MARIGFVDPAMHNVRPIAALGYEDGYLNTLFVISDNVHKGMGVTGTSIREKRPLINNDISSDPRMTGYQAEAARRGYRSSVSIPRICNSEAIGVM